MIYFVQPTNGGPIRIGCTENLELRLKGLGVWMPGGIELLAKIDGGFLKEAILLRAMEPVCVERDWFQSGPAMWSLVMEAQDGGLNWLPCEMSPAPRHDRSDIEAEFGGLEAATKALGYANVANLLQAANNYSLRGYGLGARIAFHRLLRDELLPPYVARLHGHSAASEVA